MRHFITAAMCTLGLILVGISIYQQSNQEVLMYGNLERNSCKTFSVPDIDAIEDPQVLFDILSKTANDTGSNIIKTSLIDGDADGDYEIVKYILIKNEDSNYIRSFQIKSGRMLSEDDTSTFDTNSYISTKYAEDENQVGVIENNMLHMGLTVYPFGTLFQFVKANGLYYVDLPETVSEEEFIKSLQANIEIVAGIHVEEEALQGNESTVGIPYADLSQYYIMFAFAFVLFVLLIFYYLLKKKRDIAIMKLMGVKDSLIWKNLLIEPILAYPLVILLSLLIIAFYKNNTCYAFHRVTYALIFYPLIIAIYLVVFHISIAGLSFMHALKGKNYTTGIMYLHGLVELICVIFVMYIGAGVFINTKSLIEEINRYDSWEIADNYGVFYPFYNGDDQTVEDELQRDQMISTELYHYLNEGGALYVDASDYEQHTDTYGTENSIKSLRVNPNYLDIYILYDEDGEQIKVDEREQDLIILVPESEKAKEQEIINYYEQNQKSFREIEEENYNTNTTDLKNQNIRIIWMKDNQYVFTFDEAVDENAGEVLNPIVVVYTENNTYSCQRIGILGNGTSDPLKIKLKGSSKDTYADLATKLKEFGLADNLKALVSINEQMKESTLVLKANLLLSLKILAALFVLIIYLTYQFTYLMFEKNKKKYTVLQMFGVGWFQIIGKQCAAIVGCIVLIAAFYLAFIQYGGYQYVITMALLIILLHISVILICISRQLRMKRSDILKGV